MCGSYTGALVPDVDALARQRQASANPACATRHDGDGIPQLHPGLSLKAREVSSAVQDRAAGRMCWVCRQPLTAGKVVADVA